jgi:hypothetical protein
VTCIRRSRDTSGSRCISKRLRKLSIQSVKPLPRLATLKRILVSTKVPKTRGTSGIRIPTVVPFADPLSPGIKEPGTRVRCSSGNEDRRGRIACTVRNVDGRISAKCQQGCG